MARKPEEIRKLSVSKPGPNFKGYKRNYFRSKGISVNHRSYKVNEKAIEMVKKLVSENELLNDSSRMKASTAGPDKLKQLDFDPIEVLVKQLKEIDKFILLELEKKDPRVSFIEKMQESKLRILETLLPYRYGKAPSIAQDTQALMEPIRIILQDDTKPMGENTGPEPD
jgi:hypothetical protein